MCYFSEIDRKTIYFNDKIFKIAPEFCKTLKKPINFVPINDFFAKDDVLLIKIGNKILILDEKFEFLKKIDTKDVEYLRLIKKDNELYLVMIS